MAVIALIYPSTDEKKKSRYGYSLRLLSLATKLSLNKYKCYIEDLSFKPRKKSILLEKLKLCDALIVELDSYTLRRSSNYKSGENLIQYLRKNELNIPIICFGRDIDVFPRLVEGATVSCKGEIEDSIELLVDKLLKNSSLDLEGIAGIYYRKKNVTVWTGEKPLIENLDVLPHPERSLLSYDVEYLNGYKSALVETSRGCGNKCVFCQRYGWNKGRYRKYSIAYVMEEFERLKRENYKNIWIIDDNFSFDIDRAKSLLENLSKEQLTKGMKISLSSWTNIDKEFLKIAKFCGVSIISFGIESANEEILKFYNKKVCLKKTMELINFCDEIGIFTVGNFIIGAPLENEYSIRDTFQYVVDVPFDDVNIKILNYFAGSLLFERLPPSIKKNRRSIPACKGYKLNKYKLSELNEYIHNFYKLFKYTRKEKLQKKISRWGEPYFGFSNSMGLNVF